MTSSKSTLAQLPSNDTPTFIIGFQSRYSFTRFVVLLCRSNADVNGSRKFGLFAPPLGSGSLVKLSVESRLMYWYLRRPDSVSNIVFLYSAHTLFECDLS